MERLYNSGQLRFGRVTINSKLPSVLQTTKWCSDITQV